MSFVNDPPVSSAQCCLTTGIITFRLAEYRANTTYRLMEVLSPFKDAHDLPRVAKTRVCLIEGVP